MHTSTILKKLTPKYSTILMYMISNFDLTETKKTENIVYMYFVYIPCIKYYLSFCIIHDVIRYIKTIIIHHRNRVALKWHVKKKYTQT